jgi:chromosomal replication initiator protein
MTQINPATTWAATLGHLQMLVTPANYETWLRDTIGLRFDDGCFVVGAQSDFATEWLHARLRPLIARTLARTLGHAVDLAFEVVGASDAPPPPALDASTSAAAAADAVPDFLRRSSAPAPALHPALTFERFVVGDENRLAFEAARRAAEHPGVVNPLAIVGACGLGKTHLLNAIGHVAHAAGRSVIYAPAERFGNDYVRALSQNKLDDFRARYRRADLLLIDDIQFLAGKDKFQDEFIHAFNDLHAAGKQIVVACHAMPSHMAGLSETLRSRLEMGLVADLQKPAFPTRLAILRDKARRAAVVLPDIALEQIAERCCPTVRELEGYLNRVVAYAPLVGITFDTDDRGATRTAALDTDARGTSGPTALDADASRAARLGTDGRGAMLTAALDTDGRGAAVRLERHPTPDAATIHDMIERALSPLAATALAAGDPAPDADALVAAVCQRVGVTPADLRGRSRTRDVTYARHLAMYLLKEDARKTVAEIGRLFGNRDHSTVLAGIARIQQEQKTRPETAADITATRTTLAPTPPLRAAV